jgi:hypothetical protein
LDAAMAHGGTCHGTIMHQLFPVIAASVHQTDIQHQYASVMKKINGPGSAA